MSAAAMSAAIDAVDRVFTHEGTADDLVAAVAGAPDEEVVVAGATSEGTVAAATELSAEKIGAGAD